LLVGAILAPGIRTVTATLRVMGLSAQRQFQNYHHVHNRAKWSSRSSDPVALAHRGFVPPDHPIVLGLDDYIERRAVRRSPSKAFIVTRFARVNRSLSRTAYSALH
jgi:hypothetical protein